MRAGNAYELVKLVMQELEIAKLEQLVNLFSDCYDDETVVDAVFELAASGYLIRRKRNPPMQPDDVILWKAAYTGGENQMPTDEQIVNDRSLWALWAIANYGSKNINYIMKMPEPMSYLIACDSGNYDAEKRYLGDNMVTFTVFRNIAEVYAASRIRALNIPQGGDDPEIHIAVVYNHAAIEDLGLREAGYSRYCIIDPQTHIPEYGCT